MILEVQSYHDNQVIAAMDREKNYQWSWYTNLEPSENQNFGKEYGCSWDNKHCGYILEGLL